MIPTVGRGCGCGSSVCVAAELGGGDLELAVEATDARELGLGASADLAHPHPAQDRDGRPVRVDGLRPDRAQSQNSEPLGQRGGRSQCPDALVPSFAATDQVAEFTPVGVGSV